MIVFEDLFVCVDLNSKFEVYIDMDEGNVCMLDFVFKVELLK